MRTKETIEKEIPITEFVVEDIDEKYVYATEVNNKENEIKIPKYKSPLETEKGKVLFINQLGMYDLK